LRCNFHQINFGLIGYSKCFLDSDDSKRFIIFPDQSDFGNRDFSVNSMGTFSSDA